ncbi:hypothetical protein LSUE1_G009982 [Lachnellula suecica]|uniref:Uncharacterized protein n=1 Tax=Lachnellula suecica TaxID=602035 RepID=A0A8T9BQB1_9HELO|nr:hypothetical protein LSUE1_G009982 [Lachnellula suecica]
MIRNSTQLLRRGAVKVDGQLGVASLEGGVRRRGYTTDRTSQNPGENKKSSTTNSSTSTSQPSPTSSQPQSQATATEVDAKDGKEPKKKTMAELDEELKLKMEDMSGEGGGAGVEYEGGKAVGLKRGVRDNMFRVI